MIVSDLEIAIASPSFASLFHTCCINNHKMSLTLYVFCQTLALYVFCQTFKLCILSNIEIEICSRVLVLGGTLLVSPLETARSGWSGTFYLSLSTFWQEISNFSFLNASTCVFEEREQKLSELTVSSTPLSTSP